MSPSVTPNTPDVWDLLRQKHPRGPHPSLPISSSPPVNHVLPHDFNILSVLHSFPKGTACGPSELRIQHLLDAAQVHLPTPICSSLRGVVDILASSSFGIKVSGGWFSHCTSEEQGGTSIGHSPHRSWGGIETLNREVSLYHHQAQSF